MAALDSDIADARAAIVEDGSLVTWRKPAAITTEDGKPWNGVAAEPEDFTKTPILFDLPGGGLGGARFAGLADAPETNVPTGTLLGYMPGDVPFNPEINDAVYRNGAWITVQRVNPVQPGDQVILYILWFSR